MFGNRSEDFIVPKCPRCKKFDVSINIDDNSIQCNNPECRYSGNERIDINVQEFKEEIQEQEHEKIAKLLNEDPNVFLEGLYGTYRP